MEPQRIMITDSHGRTLEIADASHERDIAVMLTVPDGTFRVTVPALKAIVGYLDALEDQAITAGVFD